MGEESNWFHREIVRPDTEKLLSIQKGDYVLDVACGNGNFSKRLVDLGANVVAFDYSEKMIENAKKRCKNYSDNIEFHIIDATKYDEIIKLKRDKLFDKVVSNMALMDISDIYPLLKSTFEMIKPGGIFVYSILHPCFQSPNMRKIIETEDIGNGVITRHGIQIFKYLKPEAFEGIGIVNQPVPHMYYHRPLNELFKISFDTGFVVDAFIEPNLNDEWSNIPPIVIVRLLKIS